jgi:hypothetical protein
MLFLALTSLFTFSLQSRANIITRSSYVCSWRLYINLRIFALCRAGDGSIADSRRFSPFIGHRNPSLSVFLTLKTHPLLRLMPTWCSSHMIEPSVREGLGWLVGMIDSNVLGRGAAECPYGVVRRAVLATRRAPATCLIV